MPNFPAWASYLQPASFNGVPFVTDGSTYSTGRRVAVHSYPYRDNPWIEDLGLATRSIQFRGFLNGDDVYQQRDALKRACETGGNGTLVHPSMGSVQAALVSAGFSESVDRGRTVEVQFQFIIADTKPRWPTADVQTQDNTATQVAALNSASSGNFFQQVGSAIQQGTSAIQGVINTAQGFVGQVTATMRDAAGIVGSVTGSLGLGNVVGRFCGGISSANSVLSGLSRINGNLNSFGSFLSSGIGSGVSGGLYGVSSLNFPPSTVIGGNIGTIGSLSGVASVLTANTNNIQNFVNANQSQITGFFSSGISAGQQVTQQVGSAINQTTAIRALVTGAANSVNNLASNL